MNTKWVNLAVRTYLLLHEKTCNIIKVPKNEFTVFLTLESYDENFGASLFKYSCESVPSQGLSIFCTSTYHKMACNSTKAPKNNMQSTQKYNFYFAHSVKIVEICSLRIWAKIS